MTKKDLFKLLFAQEHSLSIVDEGGVEMDVDDRIEEIFQEGDKSCCFQIGDRIKKSVTMPGDVCKKGTKGIVIGNKLIEDTEFYIVKFDGIEHPNFTMLEKIEKDDTVRSI